MLNLVFGHLTPGKKFIFKSDSKLQNCIVFVLMLFLFAYIWVWLRYLIITC